MALLERGTKGRWMYFKVPICVHDSTSIGTSVFQDNLDCPDGEKWVYHRGHTLAESVPVSAERQNKARGIAGTGCCFWCFCWYTQLVSAACCRGSVHVLLPERTVRALAVSIHCSYCSVLDHYANLLDAEKLLQITLMASEPITRTCSLLQGSNPCERD